MIETRRLTLTPAAPQHLLTLIERPDASPLIPILGGMGFSSSIARRSR